MFGLTVLELVAVYGAVGAVLGLMAGYWLGALRERRRNQTFIAQELAACGSVLSLNRKINVLEQTLDDEIDLDRATRVRVAEIEKALGISLSQRDPDQQATETAGRADDTMYPTKPDKD